MVVVDLDGVIWLGSEPIPGGAEAIAQLRAVGARVVFLTNNSMPTRLQLRGKLARMGIDCGDDELINSPQAAASLLHAGERVLIVGGAGIVEAVEVAGCIPVPAGKGMVPAIAPGGVSAETSASATEPRLDADVGGVIVGLDLRFDYRRLAEASAAIRRGARFIATNDDSTYPVPGGLTPGGGAIVAAIATAAGTQPVIAGKPHDPIVRLLEERVGRVDVVIGDRPSTDGALARRLGARFALVTTGVTAGGGAEAAAADVVAPSLSDVVPLVLA